MSDRPVNDMPPSSISHDQSTEITATPQGTLPAAVLWDMDGTLVDTEPYWIDCEFALVRRFGGQWSLEQAHSLVGNDLRTSAEILARDGGIDLAPDQIIDELLDGVAERVRAEIPWRPGARELLAELIDLGVPNALVTMSYQRLADAVLEQLAPGTFTTVVTGDQVAHGKPHPEPYLTAAQRLQVAPADCVAIEDSPSGVTSAQAAGVPLIAVEHLVPLDGHVRGRIHTTLAGLRASELIGVATG